jgi:hypothetical protein
VYVAAGPLAAQVWLIGKSFDGLGVIGNRLVPLPQAGVGPGERDPELGIRRGREPIDHGLRLAAKKLFQVSVVPMVPVPAGEIFPGQTGLPVLHVKPYLLQPLPGRVGLAKPAIGHCQKGHFTSEVTVIWAGEFQCLFKLLNSFAEPARPVERPAVLAGRP